MCPHGLKLGRVKAVLGFTIIRFQHKKSGVHWGRLELS